jgi:uncharacterized protein YqeY
MDSPGADDVVARMRADLPVAMKARDASAVSALRTGLAAIANAEAPELSSPASGANRAPVEPVVGRLVEHTRLDLSVADVERILRHEIADRQDTIAAIEAHGRDTEVDDLRAEIAVLERYVS